jgi:cytoskeletal protein CcmA (bactofilin family)
MKNIRRYNQEGIALIIVLFMMTAISLMLGMLIKLSGQRAFTSKHLVDQVKALAYAEAGIDYAYSILSVDFDQRNNPDAFLLDTSSTNGGTTVVSLSPDNDGFFSLMMGQLGFDEETSSSPAAESSYGEGSFALTLTSISNKYVIVSSVGKVGSASQTVEILVDDENAESGGLLPDYSNMEGFDYAAISGGTFDFGGSGTITSSNGMAKVHSNSPMEIKGNVDTDVSISSHSTITIGNNKTITGNVTTPYPDWGPSVTITGTASQQPVPAVEIPDIDLTPYFNWATKHGQVLNGDRTINSATPAGGIIWVNGDVTIPRQAVINGSIIATGNIHITGQANINSTTATFSVASRDGNIKNSSSGTLKGLIYAKTGNYSQTANGTIEGQLIVNGSIKKAGNSEMNITYARSVPSDPDPSSTEPVDAWPVIAAWQK